MKQSKEERLQELNARWQVVTEKDEWGNYVNSVETEGDEDETEEEEFLRLVGELETKTPSQGIPIDDAMAEIAEYMERGETPAQAWKRMTERYAINK